MSNKKNKRDKGVSKPADSSVLMGGAGGQLRGNDAEASAATSRCGHGEFLLPVKEPSRRVVWIVLIAVLAVASILRLVSLNQSPPGLNQDEAVIAWNSYCLLHTGKDALGHPWPAFYCMDYYGTLAVYALMPFQAVFGMSPVTTRLPAAVGGILTVLLAFVVGRRLFGSWAGLAVAAMLAVNPWHVQQSRWGHEAALCPLAIMLSIAMILWANLPFVPDRRRVPHIVLSFFAGAMVGISCYGYAANKLFLPAFLLMAVAATWRNWWDAARTRQGALTIAAAAVGLAATFGPLLHRQLTDPSMISRGDMTFLWKQVDPQTGKEVSAAKAAGMVADRYVGHFLPDFLFVRGDHYLVQQGPPGYGEFHWYDLPLMLAGLGVVIWRLRASCAARFLLAWVLAYPVPDMLSVHMSLSDVSMHALRSLPGMVCLPMLAAVGLVAGGAWLARWNRSGALAAARVLAQEGRVELGLLNRSPALAAACALGIAAAVLNVRFFTAFYGDFNRNPALYHAYHVDLLEACDWLRPRMDKIDAVFVTTNGFNLPYLISLVGLDYSPEEWFRDPWMVLTGHPERFSDPNRVETIMVPSPWVSFVRFGKMNFLYGDFFRAHLDRLLREGNKRIVFIVRPGETGWAKPPKDQIIVRPDGAEVLYIYDQTLPPSDSQLIR